MAKLKGIKTVTVDAVKPQTTVDNTKTHDTTKTAAQILGREKKARKDPKHYISHHRGHGKVSNKVVVKKGDKVDYVERLVGDALVEKDGWSYGKKSEWKKLIRDA